MRKHHRETPIRMWVWRPQDTKVQEVGIVHGCGGWLLDTKGLGMYSYRSRDLYKTRAAAVDAMRGHLVRLASGAL